MSSVDVPLERGGFGKTARRDTWWLYPLLTFLGLGAFLVYANWAAWQGNHYSYGPYLSPMYSPLIFGHPGEDSWFGQMPAFIPSFVTVAMLILIFPGGFRITCYYYRGAYYKAFWADPPNCTVGEPRKKYLGRALLSPDHSKHPSLLPLRRAPVSGFSGPRCLEGALV